jgi:hypothetical protein
MQTTLQEQFHNAMNQLEIRIEKSTQTMFQELGQFLSKAVDTMNAQVARADALLKKFTDEAMTQNTTLLKSISDQIAGLHPHK